MAQKPNYEELEQGVNEQRREVNKLKGLEKTLQEQQNLYKTILSVSSTIKRNVFKHAKGFTIIEIIAVMVIIGVLSAIAIPKLFNIRQSTREEVLYTAVSELNLRVNQHFASQLLDGKTVGAITYYAADVDINLGDNFSITQWNAAEDNKITFEITYYPDLTDHDQNPVSRKVSITKPITGT